MKDEVYFKMLNSLHRDEEYMQDEIKRMQNRLEDVRETIRRMNNMDKCEVCLDIFEKTEMVGDVCKECNKANNN